MFDLTQLHTNPNNPQKTTEEDLKRLRESIDRDPQYMEARPIVYDGEKMVRAGNKRYLQLIELGYTEVPEKWVFDASAWTEEQLDRFIMIDNERYGEVNWEIVDETWGFDTVVEWGVKAPKWESREEDYYSDQNKEYELEAFSDGMKIVLEFTSDDYYKVKEELEKRPGTPEAIIYNLLGLNE